MKKHLSKRLTALLLALVLCLGLTVPVGATESSGGTNVRFEQVDNSVVSGSLRNNRVVQEQAETPLYRDTDMVRVSIILSGKSTIEKGFATLNIAENSQAMAYRDRLQAQQDTVASRISQKALGGQALDVVWNLTLAANIISANVPYGDIEAIKAVSGVEDVVLETRYEPAVVGTDPTDPNMATSSEMIGSGLAWAAGYTGAGSRIAIIDTGTDTDHQSFDAGAFEYAIAEDAEKAEKTVADYNLLTVEEIAEKLSKLNASKRSSGLTANDLYRTSKLPFGYNYIDKGLEITHDEDTQGEHGSHVAGIATANRYIPVTTGEGDDAKTTYEPALDVAKTQGVAPDAQLLTMKVFGKGGGAYDSDYMAAIEDAIVLGCDSINLSLGSSSAGMVLSEDYQDIMDMLEGTDTVVCISAGNSGNWAENTSYGLLYNDGVNQDTVGSPGSFGNALTVASIDNDGGTANYFTASGVVTYYYESYYNNDPMFTLAEEGKEYDYVMLPEKVVGNEGDFEGIDVEGKFVFVQRGSINFSLKADNAAEKGAIATVIYNNAPGTLALDLSGYTHTAPCVGITQAEGAAIMKASTPVKDEDTGAILYYTGKLTVAKAAAITDGDGSRVMSDFSSWGVPGDLSLKPEITAPGGNIYSVNGAVAGGQAYENMSGTSMAAPQVTGMVAVLAQYLRESGLAKKTGESARHLAQSLLMSTAEPVVDEDSGSYYPVLQQGAGLANVNAAIQAHSYLTVAGQTDGKVKVELGDDPGKTGIYTATFTIHNFTDKAQSYALSADVFTQDVFTNEFSDGSTEDFLDTWTVPLSAVVVWDTESSSSRLDVQAILDYVAGKAQLTKAQMEAYDLDGDGEVTSHDAYLALQSSPDSSSVVVPANGSLTVTATIGLGAEADYLDNYYPNGAYIEAYLYAKESATDEGVEGTVHSIPVLGFYGNWSDASMYDVGSYLAYTYGDEDRVPYLYEENNIYGNYFSVKHAGDSTEYPFGGNPRGYWGENDKLHDDASYNPARNAINANDTLYKIHFAAIRNAGGAYVQVTNAETGDPYLTSELGDVTAAFYYASDAAWQNYASSVPLNWSAAQYKLDEGTRVNVSLVLAPEYYASADGSYNWKALMDGVLGDGAYFNTTFVIDNTAPELLNVTQNLTANTLTVEVQDKQYVAYIALFDSNGELVMEDFPDQETADTAYTKSFNLSEIGEEDDHNLYVAVYDYADNQSTYKLVVGKEAGEPENPTDITLTPDTLTLVKGNSAALTVKYTPWVVQEGVKWESSDETVATVKNGVVTAVGAGKATITATSTADYPEGETPASGTCKVEVIAIAQDLNGIVWDEDGYVWISGFNTDKLPEYTKLTEEPSAQDLCSAAYLGDTLYAADLVGSKSTLYTVDPEKGYAVTEIGGSSNGYMDLAPAPNISGGTLLAAYGPYVLIVDPATGDYTDAVTYMENGAYLVGIAYVGSVLNKHYKTMVDVYALIDTDGNVYLEAFMMYNGRPVYFYGSGEDAQILAETGISSSNSHNSAYYNGSYLYWSQFLRNNNQVNLYAIDIDSDETAVYMLGSFADGVWPVGGLFELKTSGETDTTVTDALAEKVMNAEAKNVTFVEEIEEIESIERNTASQVGGSLNAIRVTDSSEKNAVVKTAGIHGTGVSGLTTVTLDVTAEESTNGKLTFDYDAKTLTLVSVNTEKGIMSSYNDVKDDGNGQLTFAYAAAEAVNGKVATLTFSYDQNTCPNTTDVVSTTLEDGEDLDLKAEKTITFKLRNTVVIPGEPSTPATPAEPEPELPFTDVTEEHPFYEDIQYVYGKGLMKGVSSDLFQSTASTSRGMIAAILYRMEGEPAVSGSNPFSDVADGSYCDDATVWAAKCGVVKGYGDGTFRPGQAISREQMAAILYRYAQYKGCDVSVGEDTNILSYTDATQVAEFAVPAFQWAVGAGIINGTSTTTLSPKGNATRGQVAAILHRYAEWIG